MSGFTKKDLEWWKREHKSPMSVALLARLEAAEAAVNQAYRCNPDNTEYYKKWQASKGESK